MSDRSNRRLTWLLAAAVVLSTLGVVYASATPNQRIDPYSELYLKGLDGNASDYPQNLAVGETGRLVVGLSNHENRAMEYTLVFRLGNETIESRTVTVGDRETWEREYAFTPDSSGRKRFEVRLYRGSEASPSAEPYKSVYLWVAVEES